jgi:hypothetical protein
MRVTLPLICATSANTFYYAPLIPCYLKGANWVANANQASTRSVVIALSGGSTICSGSVSATLGTPVEGTMTSTEAYLKQAITKTTPLSIVINLTGSSAATVIVDLDLDEFKSNL